MFEIDLFFYCFSIVGCDVVMVIILCDLLIRVVYILEYFVCVFKNVWVEVVVFSWKESKYCYSDLMFSWCLYIGKKCGGMFG